MVSRIQFIRLLSIVIFLYSCKENLTTVQNYKIQSAQVDLSHETYSKLPVYSLEGEWNFYYENFVSKNELEKYTSAKVKFPGTWKGLELGDKTLSGIGFGTAHIRIKLPEQIKEFAIATPQFGLSANVFANEKLIHIAGRTSPSKETYTPAFNLETITVQVPNDHIVDIICHISNYDDPNGGMWSNFQIGDPNHLNRIKQLNYALEFCLFGIFFAMGIYHIIVYSFRRKSLSPLFFGIFCLALSLRILLSGEKSIYLASKDEYWVWLFRLEFISYYLALGNYSLFVSHLFPKDFNFKIIYGFNVFILLFILEVIFSPAIVFTQVNNLFHLVSLIGIIIILIYFFRAYKNKREGVKLYLLATFIMILALINDVLVALQISHIGQVAQYCLVMYVIIQAIMLARIFTKAFKDSEILSKSLQHTNTALEKFVPKEFLSYLGRANITEVQLGDHTEKEIAILFCDIRGFTKLSDSMTPDETFKFINSYLKRMGPYIRENNGFIDKYIGDAIMGLFPNGVEDAISAAVAIQKQLYEYNSHRSKMNYPPIEIGIGIHYGELMLGTVGESNRIDSTVISAAVNLASRIEKLNKIFGTVILISKEAMQKNKNAHFLFRGLPKVKVDGSNEKIKVYEVLNGFSEQEKKEKINTLDTFQDLVTSIDSNDKLRAKKEWETLKQNHLKDNTFLSLYSFIE
jgi:class 3 adenylate cyclase